MLNITPNESVRTAWNKGKLVGQKPPLQQQSQRVRYASESGPFQIV